MIKRLYNYVDNHVNQTTESIYIGGVVITKTTKPGVYEIQGIVFMDNIEEIVFSALHTEEDIIHHISTAEQQVIKAYKQTKKSFESKLKELGFEGKL